MDLVKIKKRSLNEEVKEALLGYIKSIDTDKNNKLPREEALAGMLGVSRVTIRRALSELSQEGAIYRIHGKGTFINSEFLQIKVTFNPAQEFENMIINSGYKADVELANVEIVRAGHKVAAKLQIDPEDEIIVVEKIFYADDNPAIFCIDRFPKKIIGSEVHHSEMKETVFSYLKRTTNKTIIKDIVEISTEIAIKDSKLYTYMNCSEAKSFLVFDSVNFDQDNTPLIYDTEYYDTDFIRFNSYRQKQV